MMSDIEHLSAWLEEAKATIAEQDKRISDLVTQVWERDNSLAIVRGDRDAWLKNSYAHEENFKTIKADNELLQTQVTALEQALSNIEAVAAGNFDPPTVPPMPYIYGHARAALDAVKDLLRA